MIIFFYNLKRIFKRKSSVLSMFILPVIVMLLTINMRFYRTTVKIAIIDKDKSAASEQLISEISKNSIIVYIDEQNIQNSIALQKIDYAVVIYKGFESEIINGKAEKIKAYYDGHSNVHQILESNLKYYINLMKTKGEYAKGDKNIFYSSVKQYNAKADVIETGIGEVLSIRMTLTFLIMFVLIFSVNNSMLILKENDKSLLLRTITAPISIRKYMFQSILSIFVIALLQVSILFIIMVLYYNSFIFSNIFSLYIVFFVFSGVSVALSVFISTVSKKTSNFGAFSSFIMIPLCMLGGCFWSIDMMPQSMQYVSCLVPTTWAVKAIESIVIKNYNLFQVKENIFIMLMFIIVFLLLGVEMKKDIVN